MPFKCCGGAADTASIGSRSNAETANALLVAATSGTANGDRGSLMEIERKDEAKMVMVIVKIIIPVAMLVKSSQGW